MLDPDGRVDTEHSVNPVPFIMVDNELFGKPQPLASGTLADVAPTVLAWKGIDIPGQMTGNNLLAQLPRRPA